MAALSGRVTMMDGQEGDSDTQIPRQHRPASVGETTITTRKQVETSPGSETKFEATNGETRRNEEDQTVLLPKDGAARELRRGHGSVKMIITTPLGFHSKRGVRISYLRRAREFWTGPHSRHQNP